MVAGKTPVYDVWVWSTLINRNTPKITIRAEDANVATYIWHSDAQQCQFLLHDEGVFTFEIRIGNPTMTAYDGFTNTFTVTLPMEEGRFFIKNAELNNYMQIDDNSDVTQNGAFLELWDFDGEDYQRWDIIHVINGFYKIASLASTKVLTAPSELDSNVTQNNYAGTDNQLWGFNAGSNGLYRIYPKSDGENSLSAGSGAIISDGRNVELREEQSDNKDRWILESLDAYKINLCGISNAGHDHSSCLEEIKGTLYESNPYSNVTLVTGSMTSNDCLDYIKNSNVFISRSHGGLVLFSGTTTASSTSILLNDEDGPGEIWLYSHPYSNMTVGSRHIASTDSFANTDMVLFIGCHTAYGGTTGRNLPAIVVAQGAEVAIGFSGSIDCSNANEWTTDFYSRLMEGYTVQESVNHASNNQTVASGLRSAVICGNGNFTISN